MASIRKLTDEHIELIKPFLPKERGGVKRVHLKKTLNGILHVLRNGGRWEDMLAWHGKYKTAYNMFRRYFLNGVWDRILEVLASRKAEPRVSMIERVSRVPTALRRAWRRELGANAPSERARAGGSPRYKRSRTPSLGPSAFT